MSGRRRGKNEGTIYKRKNGSWRAQISYSGKRFSKDFNRKSDADFWLREVRAEIAHGRVLWGGSITLGDFLMDWLGQHRSALREKTAHQYSSLILKHIQTYFGETKIKDLTPIGIDKYYLALQESSVGVRTIHIIHHILHASLDNAVRYGLLTSNPTQGAALPTYRFDEMQVLNKEQVGRFLKAARESSSFALYHLALVTGMRMGELLGLKWSDIDFESGLISVQRQRQYVPGEGITLVEPKTRYGRRTIKVGDMSLQILLAHRKVVNEKRIFAGNRWQEMDLVFPNSVGKPGDPSNIRLEFNQILEKAEIPRIRFHDLRHTAATIYLNHKIPVIVVSHILGHSRPSVTLDLYGHVLSDMQAEAASVMESQLPFAI